MVEGFTPENRTQINFSSNHGGLARANSASAQTWMQTGAPGANWQCIASSRFSADAPGVAKIWRRALIVRQRHDLGAYHNLRRIL
jgi:hypothetical protein